METAIAGAVASFGSGLVTFVAAPLALAATIYFLLLGFAVLRGAIQAPLRELVFQAGKVGFAIAAASSIGYTTFVVNVVTNLPGEIIAAGTGTPVSNPGTTFDLYVSDTSKLAKRLEFANGEVQKQVPKGLTDIQTPLIQMESTIITFLAVIILDIFAFISACVGFCIVIFAKLAVSICVALAPLALACLLFNSSRWLFDGWLKQTVNYILLMVIMAIMTKFITGLQEASMNSIINSVGDGHAFLTMEKTFIVLKIAVIVLATLACCAIYIVGTIFFFQSPSIAAGIAGGASSGGHGFLQTGANMMANKLMFKRATQQGSNSGGRGGSANRSS
ncbi:type IV secretion system protein VirB6 [Sphingomonas sp. BK481]|nr:type IV secretion system protein VirB6 [Sphingomonas sp. BK481]